MKPSARKCWSTRLPRPGCQFSVASFQLPVPPRRGWHFLFHTAEVAERNFTVILRNREPSLRGERDRRTYAFLRLSTMLTGGLPHSTPLLP